ncbi:MAG TPA: NAD-dependent epimerase [Alphaproteobacteria bacterium]|nr:NAD-dependent epimerase [Alphaproteobacteria bacterium]
MMEARPSDGVHLVTGTAGFIGYHLADRYLRERRKVIGLDCVNDYYDPKLKEDRLRQLAKYDGFVNHRVRLEDQRALDQVFDSIRPRVVVHLAAQAGVRYSLENPRAYIDSNIVGFINILEACRRHNIDHLVYASSSSVYGANTKLPFSVGDTVDHPISLYAATKKSNELMAHTYSHLYRIPTTGLRFFTVYGPWGRPDMAMFIFTKAILAGQPIKVFNNGNMLRDFTYVDDIVEGVVRVTDRPAQPNPLWSSDAPDPASSNAPYKLQNIGNNHPIELMHLIALLEARLGRKAEKIMMPIQEGDVPATYANVDPLIADTGFKPSTSIEDGVAKFVDWYRAYYGN